MCDHDWQPTGKQDTHVAFPTKTRGWRHCSAIYLRCSRCGQNGFRRPLHNPIYTWDCDPANWIKE